MNKPNVRMPRGDDKKGEDCGVCTLRGRGGCNFIGCSGRLLCEIGTLVTFEQRLEGREGASSVGIWRKRVFWVQRNTMCKGPGAGPAWQWEVQQGGPCGWSRTSKGKRERRGEQRGDRAGHAGPWGPQEDLGFYAREVGTPGGLWADGRT